MKYDADVRYVKAVRGTRITSSTSVRDTSSSVGFLVLAVFLVAANVACTEQQQGPAHEGVSEREPRLAIDANATFEFYRGPGFGSADFVFRVRGRLTNNQHGAITFDMVDGSFTSARGGRFRIRHGHPQGLRWTLMPGEGISIDDNTDGRTRDILDGAERDQVFYVVTLYLENIIVAGPFMTRLPSGKTLPESGGVPLEFKATRIEGW